MTLVIACDYGVSAVLMKKRFRLNSHKRISTTAKYSTLRLAAFTAELQNNCQLEHSCKSVRVELERAELRLIKWHKVFCTVDVMEEWIILHQLGLRVTKC